MNDDKGQINSKFDRSDEDKRSPLTVKGALHFLQHEVSQMEIERARWQADKSEMQARISILQGELKGQDNLKNNLVRRIKMLEFCLKQERTKNYRLTHDGQDPPGYEDNEVENDAPENAHITEVDAFSTDGNWKTGQNILRKYLEEVGFCEQLLDVRTFRVRNLLGTMAPNNHPLNDQSGNKKKSTSDSDSDNDHDNLDAAASEALDEFSFLANEQTEASDTNNWNRKDYKDLVELYNNDVKKRKARAGDSDDDYDTGTTERRPAKNEAQSNQDLPVGIAAARNASAAQEEASSVKRPGRRSGFANELDTALGLQLADNIDIKDDFAVENDEGDRPFKWNLKHTLRSHYDSVRALKFHPIEPVFVSVSEDSTVKLWNLEQVKHEKSSSGADIEPIHTFRGHKSPVLCLDLSPSGEQLYTGGADGEICCWNVPAKNKDPCEPYDGKDLIEKLIGHTDAVFSIVYQSSNNRLISASSDSTVRVWEPGNNQSLVRIIEAPQPGLVPTSVDLVASEQSQLLIAYTECYAHIVDLETGIPLVVFDFAQDATPGFILTKIVSHPTMSISIIASTDRKIRYFNNITGEMIHTAIGHVEAVSTLAIDPNGLYLLSGSHDGSLRIWNMEKKMCLQEISAHRKKFDAAVHCVAFHPSRPLIGSSGADCLAKIYTYGNE